MSSYDRLSPIYDLLTISERPYRRRALAMLDVRPGESLLEIGCGTGQTLLELAPVVGSGGLLVGIDLSRGMIAQARRNVQGIVAGSISLIRGNGLKLPLANDCFDALFLSFTLELFDLHDQHRLLGEARRVLRENGRLALITLSAHEQTAVSDIYWSLHELFPRAVDCRPINPAPLLEAAGFTITQIEQAAMFGLPLAILSATING